jgi:hypothetical protein
VASNNTKRCYTKWLLCEFIYFYIFAFQVQDVKENLVKTEAVQNLGDIATRVRGVILLKAGTMTGSIQTGNRTAQ